MNIGKTIKKTNTNPILYSVWSETKSKAVEIVRIQKFYLITLPIGDVITNPINNMKL